MIKGEFVNKFILGFGIGIALGMLFAPAKGEEMRARFTAKAKEVVDLPRKKAVEMADAGKKKAAELGEKIGRQTAEAAVEAVEQNVFGKDKTA